ncbi:MAG: DUF1015 domain-containing protein [Akkermansiaceae bacterium]|nr:DUF1015 domain-containing protein [Akkermansiaceae bacterium]
MVTLNPIRHALVPVDSAAAQRLCSPNYDEFQSDREIYDLLQVQPESVLRVTMPHCDAPAAEAMLEDGSPEALERAGRNMGELKDGASTRVAENVVFIYEIVDEARPGVRQIGLGGMARIDEIRTEATPRGTIIRNEGIREEKARGRMDLIKATRAIIGTVNNAVDDEERKLASAMEAHADSRACDFEATDEDGKVHRIWLVSDGGESKALTDLLGAEPCAYVADGNHRSAAAAMLGTGEFLAVFFPAATMGLAPYNRLVSAPGTTLAGLAEKLAGAFEVEKLGAIPAFEPREIHEIGIYIEGEWLKLTPKPSSFDPANAAESIDSDIVQRHIFDAILGIEDPRDKRLTFVGGNRDAAYLKAQVDAGRHDFAMTLAPVTIEQFVAVCRQNRIMPPKSTWFQPKIRSGLVMALLD